MAQSLADRLAEAYAELLHREMRTTTWGYAPDEVSSCSSCKNTTRGDVSEGLPSLYVCAPQFVLWCHDSYACNYDVRHSTLRVCTKSSTKASALPLDTPRSRTTLRSPSCGISLMSRFAEESTCHLCDCYCALDSESVSLLNTRHHATHSFAPCTAFLYSVGKNWHQADRQPRHVASGVCVCSRFRTPQGTVSRWPPDRPNEQLKDCCSNCLVPAGHSFLLSGSHEAVL